MASSNHRKGREAEIRVAEYLRANGFPFAEPTRRSGWADDRGDIDGLPGIVIEVKNRKTIKLPEYHRELDDEIANAGADTGFCVIKQRGTTDVGEWFATMPVRIFLPVLIGWVAS